ncbi:MAG: L-threonine ammonia-lyase [Chlamydiia bacterium]|nr:L-threonine ammonia-lyase [Chlamydiia bacterium]
MDDLISKARDFLKEKVMRTPLIFSPKLSQLADVPVYLKMECFQQTGSFKVRGAFFALSQLPDPEKGVVVASAGNHGLGVAYVAKQLNIPATICVPATVDEAKLNALRSYKCEVKVFDVPGFDAAQKLAIKYAEDEERPFLSAYDDDLVIAGSGGTIGLELLEQLPSIQGAITPCGGGGLPAGLAYVLKKHKPRLHFACAQLDECPALKLSLEKGEAILEMPPSQTLAGGIEGGMGKRPFALLCNRVDEVLLLTEKELYEGVRFMLREHQVLIEPSSSAAIAPLLFQKQKKLSGPTVLVVTGRNLGYDALWGIMKDGN